MNDRADRAASITLNRLATSLSHNLRLHAQKYDSISALCRACEVNRQQFNKYLTGETLPSLLNLAKISDILGVSIDELISPPTIKIQSQNNPVTTLERFARDEKVDINIGYYLDYTTSSVYRDNLLISICKIGSNRDGYYCKVKLIFKTPQFEKVKIYTYLGSVFGLNETIYINYAHEDNPVDLVYCMLQPDVRYSSDFVGLRTAMSNSSPSIPFSASFYLQYLGEKPDLRAALRQCGLYPLNDLDERKKRILSRLEAKTQIGRNIIRISHL